METRLSNILKTTNATKVIKTILGSTYKFVLGTDILAAPTQCLFVKGRWVLSNFWHLDCYKFCYILKKIPKLYFLKASHRTQKTSQKLYPKSHPLRTNGPLPLFISKIKKLTFSIFYHSDISERFIVSENLT